MMAQKIWLIIFFTVCVGSVWILSMLSTPHRGITALLENAAEGALLCLVCSVLLKPLGVRIPITPFSALLGGWLGLPGAAFSAFLYALP